MTKKRCEHCGTTRFGLIRHYRLLLHFCSRRCEQAYTREQEANLLSQSMDSIFDGLWDELPDRKLLGPDGIDGITLLNRRLNPTRSPRRSRRLRRSA